MEDERERTIRRHLDCRLDRHAWATALAVLELEGGEVVRRVGCMRNCGVEREDRWTRDGTRIGSRYRYPPDYLLHDGQPADGREIRSLYMDRELRGSRRRRLRIA